MRNFLSILLIILLLLNVFGYYGLFLGWKYRNDLSMIQKLDEENYNHAETITIKVAITVPYAADSRDFERVDGEFEHNGEFYRLVKQRLLRDTLYIVCVKDHENKKIHQALSSFAKTFSDKHAEQPSDSKPIISFIKDYIAHSFSLGNISPGWAIDVANESHTRILIPSFFCMIIHPPE